MAEEPSDSANFREYRFPTTSFGIRTYIKSGQLSKFEINAGEFIDAFLINGPTIGKVGTPPAITTPINGGAQAGIQFILMQTTLDPHGQEVMCFMCVEDNYGKQYETGTKVAKPVSVWENTHVKYLLKFVNHGAYINSIGFSQILG